MFDSLARLDRMQRQLDRWVPAAPSPAFVEPANASDEPEPAPEPIPLEGVFAPHAGPQSEFFRSTCREILYGGAAGGGKSWALTALPLLWAHLDGFLALTLRRTKPQARDLQGKSRKLYRRAFQRIRPVRSPQYTWTFPSGAQSVYGHCNNTDDWEQYQGWELNLICFDELTSFTEQQYLEICARLRSAECGLPTYIRATTNPGGDGHEWVFKRWGAWLDPEFEAPGLPQKHERQHGKPPAAPGEVWWIRTVDGAETYFRAEPANDDGAPRALSRTFIPAKLSDNPSLALSDPNYASQLESLDALRRAQLRDGDWIAKPAAGLHFKRQWVQVVEPSDVPADAQVVRYWDLAATEEPKPGEPGDPDWTVGLKVARKGQTYWIVDMVHFRRGSGSVDDAQRKAAEVDGARCLIAMPQDPGQAGKDQVRHKAILLNGYRLKFTRETGDKVTRFGPFSAQAEHHNVRVVRGSWNRAFFEALESFPDAAHDDIPDASSGAYNALTGCGQQGFGGAGEARSGERAA